MWTIVEYRLWPPGVAIPTLSWQNREATAGRLWKRPAVSSQFCPPWPWFWHLALPTRTARGENLDNPQTRAPSVWVRLNPLVVPSQQPWHPLYWLSPGSPQDTFAAGAIGPIQHWLRHLCWLQTQNNQLLVWLDSYDTRLMSNIGPIIATFCLYIHL